MKFAWTIAIVGLFPLVASAGDHWERFRGPHGSAHADDKNVPVRFGPKEHVLWKAEVPGVGHGSPVVWGARLFLQASSADGKQRFLMGFDANTGKSLWTKAIPATSAHAHELNSLASSTPATDGEAVYFSVWDGTSILLTAYTVAGEPLWTKNVGNWVSEHGAGASPILYKDKLIFALDMDRENKKTKEAVNRPSVLLALDKKTGTTVWEAPREPYRACYSVPFVVEKAGAAPELLVTSTTHVTSYNPDNGAKNWDWTWIHTAKQPLRTIASSVQVDDVLIVSGGEGGAARHTIGLDMSGAAKKGTPSKAWEMNKEFPYVPSPVANGAYVFVANDNGFVGCYEGRTGKRVWYERQPDAKFYASPLVIDGKLYAASEQGDVYIFAAGPKYELIAKNSLGERFRATPAVAHDRLYLRGQEHLFCVGQK